jgi:hypothetical protein
MRKKLIIALKVISLSFILSSCSPAVVITKVEKQYPEKKYLRDCGSPDFKKDKPVYSDLVPYIKTLQSAFSLCNSDKKALRNWVSIED